MLQNYKSKADLQYLPIFMVWIPSSWQNYKLKPETLNMKLEGNAHLLTIVDCYHNTNIIDINNLIAYITGKGNIIIRKWCFEKLIIFIKYNLPNYKLT